MSIGEIVTLFILVAVAFTAFLVGGRQLSCRGPLLNNLYPGDQTEKPDPKPYYRQSGVVMILVGVIMLVNAAAIFFHNSKLFLVNAVLLPVTVIYVLCTAALMGEKNKRK